MSAARDPGTASIRRRKSQGDPPAVTLNCHGLTPGSCVQLPFGDVVPPSGTVTVTTPAHAEPPDRAVSAAQANAEARSHRMGGSYRSVAHASVAEVRTVRLRDAES